MPGRVAIYAAPGHGTTDARALRLRDLAESWLGRRVGGGGADVGLPGGWTRRAVDAITADARRYGFHGTLKAPFRLAEGRTLDELEGDVARVAATHDAVAIPELTLRPLGDFLALVPGAAAPGIEALGDAVVTGFDAYRAPATGSETARRDPAALTPRRRELLETWGYPYVLDEFRFHLTVTDRLPAERQAEVQHILSAWFADCLGQTIPVDALALFTESEAGAPFLLHSVHPLRSPAGAARTEPSPAVLPSADAPRSEPRDAAPNDHEGIR